MKAKNVVHVSEVKVKTIAAKQGNKMITRYATMLQNLWQELNHYQVLETKCPNDVVVLKKFIQKDQIYDFFGLQNTKFDSGLDSNSWQGRCLVTEWGYFVHSS